MQIEKKSLKKWAQRVGIAAFLVFLSFFYMMNSPLNPFEGGDAGIDSSVFKYVAMMMENGYMPYKDTFDHKGPIIYIMNYIGNIIWEYQGIWFLEVACLIITFYFCYKIARLCAGRIFSCVTVFVVATMLFSYFEGGNYVEEYAMPCIAAALYIFLEYLKNGKINKTRLLLCGITFGIVCMLRPNMIAVWFIFCIAVLIQCIKEKQVKDIGKFLLWFLIGTFIVIIPITIWLAANHALPDFIEQYITFNMIYSSGAGGVSALSVLRVLTIFMNHPLVLMTIILSGFLCCTKEHFLHVSYLCCVLCTLYFMALSGNAFGHYGMVMLPMMIYPLASLSQLCLWAGIKDRAKQIVLVLVSVYFINTVVSPMFMDAAYYASLKIENHHPARYSSLVTNVSEVIKSEVSSDERISVYGNWDIIYIASERLSASKYSYQEPIGEVLPEIKEEYFKQLQEQLPRAIVIQEGRMDEAMKKFLDMNDYQEIWSEEKEGSAKIFLSNVS